MKISVNGEPKEVSSNLLAGILEELGYGEIMIATAVNEEFVPANKRSEHSVDEGDRVEVVTPRQGG